MKMPHIFKIENCPKQPLHKIKIIPFYISLFFVLFYPNFVICKTLKLKANRLNAEYFLKEPKNY